MKRTPALATLVLLAVAAPAAGARTTRTREVSATYTTAGGDTVLMTGDAYVQGQRYGATSLPTKAGDLTADVTIADKAGTAIAAELYQDIDGDGTNETELGTICGRTTAPVRLRKAGRPIEVYLLAGPCGSGVSIPTTGTVTAKVQSRR